MLINLYILSLVLGAVLLGAALFLGETVSMPTIKPARTTTRRVRVSSVSSTACQVVTTSREPCARGGSGPSSFRSSA